MYFDPDLGELRGLVANRSADGNASYALVGIDTVTGALSHLSHVHLPAQLTLQPVSSSAFDPSTGNMSLVLIDPSPKTDWSGGDPKSAWIVEFPTRSTIDKVPIPQKIDILA